MFKSNATHSKTYQPHKKNIATENNKHVIISCCLTYLVAYTKTTTERPEKTLENNIRKS